MSASGKIGLNGNPVVAQSLPGSAMDIRDGILDTIGNTPLIRLHKASDLTGCTILGKAEFLNPGGSIKDRAALAIITDAEARGLIRPGGKIGRAHV